MHRKLHPATVSGELDRAGIAGNSLWLAEAVNATPAGSRRQDQGTELIGRKDTGGRYGPKCELGTTIVLVAG